MRRVRAQQRSSQGLRAPVSSAALRLLGAVVAGACLRAAGAIAVGQPRYAIDIKNALDVRLSAGDKPLPPGALFVTARRGAACCGYADWALRLPPKGDNFKKNQSYDLFVLPLNQSSRTATLPRAATPGNTTLCLSDAAGNCLAGYTSTSFEHFVGAACEFGQRPYFEELEGSIGVLRRAPHSL